MTRSTITALLALVLAGLVLAGCGGSSASSGRFGAPQGAREISTPAGTVYYDAPSWTVYGACSVVGQGHDVHAYVPGYTAFVCT